MKLGDYLIWIDCKRARLADWWSGTSTGPEPPHRNGGAELGVQDYDAWYYGRAVARAYFNHPRRAANLVDMIERFAPARVFEFGSGLGHVLREAQRRGIRIVGSETSRYALAHSFCPESVVEIPEIPRGNLPFPDGAFDLVFSSEVLEHVTEAATLPVLRELHRVGSRRALLTINTTNLREPGHVNVHPRDWWLERFASVGFVHDDDAWRELERVKWLDWELFVFEKRPRDDGRGTAH